MHKYSHKIQTTWIGRQYLQDGFKVHHLDHIQITREEEQDEEANVGFGKSRSTSIPSLGM